MAGNTDNPRIWVNADVYVGAVGSTQPTDTTTALNAAFNAIGLLGEDGMTESREDEVTDHFAYGGILVRTTRSKHKRTFTVIALENNQYVFDLVNPGSTRTDDGTTATDTVYVPNSPNPKCVILHLVDGDVIKRRVIPECEVTEVGDVQIADNAMETRELTFTIYPDANGVLYKDLTNDTQAISA